MNLKESFRYQNFLESMMTQAQASLVTPNHAMKTVYRHLKSKANDSFKDEEIEAEVEVFFPNDNVIGLSLLLARERQTLGEAIGRAKASLPFDLDAAVDSNKFRQRLCGSLRSLMNRKPGVKTTESYAYAFDVNGVQSRYLYPMEVVTTDAFDREAARRVLRNTIADADAISAEIDAAMINTAVDYTPPFDVNDTFEDVMTAFIESGKPE